MVIEAFLIPDEDKETHGNTYIYFSDLISKFVLMFSFIETVNLMDYNSSISNSNMVVEFFSF